MNKKFNLILIALIISVGTSVYFVHRHNNLEKQISRHYENIYTSMTNGLRHINEDINSIEINDLNQNSNKLAVQLGRIQELRFVTIALPSELENKYTFLLKEIYNELYHIINNDEVRDKKIERLEEIEKYFRTLEEISQIIENKRLLGKYDVRFFQNELNSNKGETVQEINEVFNKFIN